MNSQTRIVMPNMGRTEFQRWQQMLERRVGVYLPENRKTFLQTNLLKQMRDYGIGSYQDYFEFLSQAHIASFEWARVTDLLTVHETRFFRDRAAMNVVQTFAQRKVDERAKSDSTKPMEFHIWSVGCSTGEEVYSLAMLMSELDLSKLKASNREFYYGITGIDVSYPSLAQAREGIYHKQNLANIPGHLISNYFKQLADDHLQITDSVRQRTCFLQANIRDLQRLNQHDFDVIYCQNLLIYFPLAKRKELVDKMIERLAEGGLLIIGPGEISELTSKSLKRTQFKQCQAYVKIGSSARSRVER